MLNDLATDLSMRKLFENRMIQYYRKFGSNKQKEHCKFKKFTLINIKIDVRMGSCFPVYQIVILSILSFSLIIFSTHMLKYKA